MQVRAARHYLATDALSISLASFSFKVQPSWKHFHSNLLLFPAVPKTLACEHISCDADALQALQLTANATAIVSAAAAAVKSSFDQILATWEFDQLSMAHGSFISSGGKQAFLQGSYSFVDQLVKGKAAVAADQGSGGLAGTGAAVFVAAAVISTAVGIGVAGILQVRQQ
jgi:hypothetical protein